MGQHPRPPPMRAGVGASCVAIPPGAPVGVLDFLVQRFAHISPAQWRSRLQQGLVCDDTGAVQSDQSVCRAGARLYYYRSVAHELPIAAQAHILWQDAHLLVADKPHGLPVMPSGDYLQETLLVRLRRALDAPALTPIHRIDRDTAGLVLFSLQARTRDAYHQLFRTHCVHKTYEAIAPRDDRLPWPAERHSRIAPGAHFMQMAEVAGTPNAHTRMARIETGTVLARYQLQPLTGVRHQLRVHMAALGLPILGDGIYPTLTPRGAAPVGPPLQLLARSLRFTDPLNGQGHHFESQHRLQTLAMLESGT